MKVPGKKAAATLTLAAMLGSQALTPLTALAATTEDVNSDAGKVTVGTSFSNATQRLIAAADGTLALTAAEAKALLAEVQAAADAARGADAQAQQTVDRAQQAVTVSQQQAAAAESAVTAELQAQIDRLNQQLSDAVAEAERLAQQQADATEQLEGLNGQLEAAEVDAEAKQEALDEANDALKEAQAALDALGESPTADEQAAYDEAKAVYDAAVADQTVKQEAYDKASQALASLKAQLEQKEGELDAANAALPEKQAAKEQADSALEDAKASYASVVEAIKADAVAAEKAELEQAKSTYDAAMADEDASNDAAALDALNDAQAAYDSAVANAGAEAEAEADAQIAAAQQAADQAAADLEACKVTIADTPAKIEAVEAQIAAEEAKVTEAQDAADSAATAVTEARADLTEAQGKLGALAEEQAKWDADAKPLREAVDAAQAKVDAAQGELEDANDAVSNLETQIADVQKKIDDLKAQTGEATTVAVKTYGDFLTWCAQNGHQSGRYGLANAYVLLYGNGFNELVDDGTGHLKAPYTIGNANIKMEGQDKWVWSEEFGAWLYEGKVLCEYTDLNDESDASSLANVLASLDVIDRCNELRKTAGLDPLQITQEMMIISILDANWSSANMQTTGWLEHASNTIKEYNDDMPYGMNVAENLASGYTAEGAVNAWYSEKSIWEQFCNQKGWATTDATAWSVYDQHRDEADVQAIYEQVGHYLNLMCPDYTVTGAASTDGVTGQVYNYTNTYRDAVLSWSASNNDGERYTPEQLRALINQAMAEGMDNPFIDPDTGENAELQKLEAQLNELKSQLADAEAAAAEKQGAYDDAVAAHAKAQQDLAAIGDRPTNESLKQAVTDAEAALKAAEDAKAEADENLAQVKADAIEAIDGLNAQKSDFESQLSTAENQLAGLTQAAEDAEEKLSDTKASYADLTKAADALDGAKANAATAQSTYDEAKRVADDLAKDVSDLNGQIGAQQQAVDEAKAALDAAGPTKEQTQVLKAAEEALEEAKAELQRLTGARDAAQATADAAKAAKDAADALVVKIEAQIDEQQALLDEATANLPAANDKVAAWQAVFAQEDAEEIVVDGFAGTTSDAEIAGILNDAHGAYAGRLTALADARAELEAAEEALAAAQADKKVTEQELAEKLADLAMAQDAYDRLAKQMSWDVEEAPVKQAAVKTTAKPAAKGDALTQTGDPAAVVAAGMAIAGAAAVVSGAHFRRRRSE